MASAFRAMFIYMLIITSSARPKKKNNNFHRATELSNAGIKYRENDQLEKALKKFQTVLKYRRTIFDLHNVGQLYSKLGSHKQACKIYKEALKQEPNNDRLLTNAASAFVAAGKKKDGLKYYKKAWKMSKYSNELYGYNYGITLMVDANGRGGLQAHEIKQMKKAIKVFKKVTKINPNFPEVYWKIAVVNSVLEQYSQAVLNFRKALDLYDKGFARRLRVAEVYYDLHDSLLGLTPQPNYSDAILALKTAVAHEGKNGHNNSSFKYLKYSCALLHLMKYTANYEHIDMLEKTVYALLNHEIHLTNSNKAKAMTPMRALGGGMDGKMIHDLLYIWSQSIIDSSANSRKLFNENERHTSEVKATNKQINVGFVSADFGAKHPMMHLLDVILPLLNQNKHINVFLFALTKQKQNSNGVLSQKEWSNAVNYVKNTNNKVPKKKPNNHFVYLNDHTDYSAAKVILRNNIDVLIDMNGYTMGGRPEIFAYRPANVQIGFLGWPTTIGSGNILDHTFTDCKGTIVELAHKHYKEKLVLVPPSLFIGSHKTKIKVTKFEHDQYTNRSRIKIPENAFVYSNHNQLFKLSEDLLDVWGNIFRRVRGIGTNIDSSTQNGQLLWLLRHPAAAEKSIVKELNARGIPNHEILFSDFAGQKEYITRSKAADIFLDNVRYNGGATGVDQYFGDVPSITMPGGHFVKRMGKSLAHGHGMIENVVYSMKEYEDLAVSYYYNKNKNSNNNYKFKRIKEQMASLKRHSKLFDGKKWLENFKNGIKGTQDLNVVTNGNAYHYVVSNQVASQINK